MREYHPSLKRINKQGRYNNVKQRRRAIKIVLRLTWLRQGAEKALQILFDENRHQNK